MQIGYLNKTQPRPDAPLSEPVCSEAVVFPANPSTVALARIAMKYREAEVRASTGHTMGPGCGDI